MYKIDTLPIHEENIPRQWWYVAGGCILLLAFVLRTWGVGSESAWIDEAYSIALAKHSLIQIIEGTAADQHPPLYYLLLHYWLLLGTSVVHARLLSVVFGTINVSQMMLLSKKLAGNRSALASTLMLAISPIHIWYSQEVRMYILLAVLTTASTVELWNCLRGKNRWFFYGLYSILSIYTQYFAIFVFMAHALLVLVWILMTRERNVAFGWTGTILVVGLAFLPWVKTALFQTRYHKASWLQLPGLNDFRDALLRLLGGDAVLAFPGWMRWAGFATLVASVFFICVIIFRRKNLHYGLPFFFAVIWALVPYAIISIISLRYPLFQYKQFLIIVIPLIFLFVLFCTIVPKQMGKWLFILLLLLSSSSLTYQQVKLTKDDWRGTYTYIHNHMASGDKLYTNPAACNLALSLYGNLSIPVDGYPPNYDITKGGWDGKVITKDIADAVLGSSLKGFYRVWLIEFSPDFWDPNKDIPGWLNSHAFLLVDQYFGRIHVRLYQIGKNEN